MWEVILIVVVVVLFVCFLIWWFKFRNKEYVKQKGGLTVDEWEEFMDKIDKYDESYDYFMSLQPNILCYDYMNAFSNLIHKNQKQFSDKQLYLIMMVIICYGIYRLENPDAHTKQITYIVLCFMMIYNERHKINSSIVVKITNLLNMVHNNENIINSLTKYLNETNTIDFDIFNNIYNYFNRYGVTYEGDELSFTAYQLINNGDAEGWEIFNEGFENEKLENEYKDAIRNMIKRIIIDNEYDVDTIMEISEYIDDPPTICDTLIVYLSKYGDNNYEILNNILDNVDDDSDNIVYYLIEYMELAYINWVDLGEECVFNICEKLKELIGEYIDSDTNDDNMIISNVCNIHNCIYIIDDILKQTGNTDEELSGALTEYITLLDKTDTINRKRIVFQIIHDLLCNYTLFYINTEDIFNGIVEIYDNILAYAWGAGNANDVSTIISNMYNIISRVFGGDEQKKEELLHDIIIKNNVNFHMLKVVNDLKYIDSSIIKGDIIRPDDITQSIPEVFIEYFKAICEYYLPSLYDILEDITDTDLLADLYARIYDIINSDAYNIVTSGEHKVLGGLSYSDPLHTGEPNECGNCEPHKDGFKYINKIQMGCGPILIGEQETEAKKIQPDTCAKTGCWYLLNSMFHGESTNYLPHDEPYVKFPLEFKEIDDKFKESKSQNRQIVGKSNDTIYSSHFEVDTVLYCHDEDPTIPTKAPIVYVEYDEDNQFHVNYTKPGYVKKNIAYNNLILNGNNLLGDMSHHVVRIAYEPINNECTKGLNVWQIQHGVIQCLLHYFNTIHDEYSQESLYVLYKLFTYPHGGVSANYVIIMCNDLENIVENEISGDILGAIGDKKFDNNKIVLGYNTEQHMYYVNINNIYKEIDKDRIPDTYYDRATDIFRNLWGDSIIQHSIINFKPKMNGRAKYVTNINTYQPWSGYYVITQKNFDVDILAPCDGVSGKYEAIIDAINTCMESIDELIQFINDL